MRTFLYTKHTGTPISKFISYSHEEVVMSVYYFKNKAALA